MLYDPKWDKPSLAGFRAWLERQDPKATFNYGNCHCCAVGQYLESIGTSWHQTDGLMVTQLNHFVFLARIHSGTNRPTFGAVLREIDKAA